MGRFEHGMLVGLDDDDDDGDGVARARCSLKYTVTKNPIEFAHNHLCLFCSARILDCSFWLECRL